MNKLYSAGLVLFRLVQGQRYYLLLHYPAGHWDFPKGGIEKGESPQEAALRELKEETGLKAEFIPGFKKQIIYRFEHDGKLFEKQVTFFLGQTNVEHVVLSSEHIDFAWLDYHQAEAQLTFLNAKEVLKNAELFLVKEKF